MILTTEKTIPLCEVLAALRAAGLDLRATIDGGARIIRRPQATDTCSVDGCPTAATIRLGYRMEHHQDGPAGVPYCARHALERM